MVLSKIQQHRKMQDVLLACNSDADIAVMDNGIFENTDLLEELGEVKAYYNQKITL